MTELQASLIAIGGAIVVGVVSYNKWQEWRARKSVESAFSPLEEDVLMGDGRSQARQEPVLDPLDIAGSGDVVPVLPDDEPRPLTDDAVAPGERSIPRTSTRPTAAVKPPPLDDLIDCIIPMPLEAPLRGEKIATAFQRLHLVGNKPVQVVGQSETGDWEKVAVGGVYTGLQVGVLMATRSGPLSELEFSELVTGLNQLADELDGEPELPDMPEVMARARQLHQRIAEYDAQLSINVQAKGAPWSLNTLRPALQRMGMEARPDGRLVMPDGDGGVLFSVMTNAQGPDQTTTLITLLLPVAQVAPERDGFTAMTAFGKSLVTRLAGALVDDEGQPLAEATLTAIGAQVQSFYEAMAQAGIPAGSHRAQRLFV